MTDLTDALAKLNDQIARLKRNSLEGLLAAGRVIEEGARELVPVHTGELRDSSYTRQTGPHTVEVGFSAEHAPFIHRDDDMKLEGEPRNSGDGRYWGPSGTSEFLAKSLEENGERALQAFKDALKE